MIEFANAKDLISETFRSRVSPLSEKGDLGDR